MHARRHAASRYLCLLVAWSALLLSKAWLSSCFQGTTGSTSLRGAKVYPAPLRKLHLRRSAGEDESLDQNFALPERAASHSEHSGGSSEEGAKVAQLQLPLSERFGLAYTCGKCGTRNTITVSRVAWNQGVVVATCRGCSARHLLADNEARMDMLNDTGFTNIVQVLEDKGETVTKLDRFDAEALAALNLSVDEEGRLRLSDAELSATPPKSMAPVASEQVTSTPPPAKSEAASPAAGKAAAEPGQVEDVDVAPLIVRVPPGVSSGDVLMIKSEFGDLHVLVPSGACDGCRLEIEGMVEVGLGDSSWWLQAQGQDQWVQTTDWSVGDTIAINMPEGQVARIKIPESSGEDATLRIAFPVVLLPS
eukprot:TRINITY_DN31057_c0_g1_i1.p1 TRINITY_DN31057_c0_g1~~TRINITY_DN31057_c0_g1_i1.p1  ORF type:complete len:364 (-),score=87.05 TRINITY_DN31057_c0_g1_i1:121-1212(-)